MELIRTANAGVLLKLDGVSILLDGVCREIKPYLATPPDIRAALCADLPDAVAYTHAHKDHYDPVFAAAYQRQKNGVILGPADLPGCKASALPAEIGGVKITPVSSRHIGAAGKNVAHMSFIIEGSSCVWFLGDASTFVWKDQVEFPSPDVLIVPYAYATTRAGWSLTQKLAPKVVVLLHLPRREEDTLGLWPAVDETTRGAVNLRIPQMGERIVL